jgi:hypothetical protein
MKNLLHFLDEPSENEEVSKEFGDYVKILISDDAPQFHNISELRGLCWWHEVRLFEKIRPLFLHNRKILEDFTGKVWDYYEELDLDFGILKIAQKTVSKQEKSECVL